MADINFKRNNTTSIQNELQRTQMYKKVTVILEDGRVDVSLFLLLLPSKFIREAFEGEEDFYKVIIPDSKVRHMKQVVEFLLTGIVKWTVNDLMDGLFDLICLLFDIDNDTCWKRFHGSPDENMIKRKEQLNTYDKFGRQVFKVEKDTCQYCFKYFPRQDQLKQHILSKHSFYKSMRSREQIQAAKSKRENIQQSVQSKRTSSSDNSMSRRKIFKSSDLSKDERAEDSVQNEKSEILTANRKLSTESMEENVTLNEKFECPTCRKVYKSYSSLDRHLKQKNHKHPEADVYPEYKDIVKGGSKKCDICNRRVHRLEHHKQKHHSEESRTFKCSDCNYTTDRKDTFDKHQYNKHRRISRDFKAIDETFKDTDIEWTCFECQRTFTNALDIENHTLLQNCEEICCEICGKIFKERSNMLQHVRNVHENPKSHSCNICGNKYSHKSSLTKHLRKCSK